MTNLSVLPKSEISAQKCHSCSCSLRLRVWDSATSMMLCIARWPVSQWNGGVRMAKYETYVREPRERSGEQRLKTHQFGSRGRVAVMISVVSSPTRNDLDHELQKLHYSVALQANRPALAALFAYVRCSQGLKV